MNAVYLKVLYIIKFAMPILAGNIAYALLGVSDTIMSGIVGTSDLAGVAVGGSFFFPAIMFISGIISAMHPVVSRLRGAKDFKSIPETHFISTFVCFWIGVIIMLILLILALFVVNLEADARMNYVAKWYIVSIAFAMPVFAILCSSRAFCEAMGRVRATLYFGILALCYNVPLNLVFIFGIGPFPKLGGIGCGVGTTLSIILSLISCLIYIHSVKNLRTASFLVNKERLSLKKCINFFKLSFPLGLAASVETSCFCCIALFISPLGPVAVSSHTIAMTTSSLLFNLPLSMGIACSINVGFYIGEKNLDALKTTIKAAYRIAFIGIIVNVAILCLLNNWIPRLFSNDESVIAFAGTLLLFAAANQFGEHIQTIQAFILRGFKDTKTIFKSTLLSFYIIALPVGYVLCYNLIESPFTGPKGFWVGICSGLIFATIYYRRRVLYHWRKLKSETSNYFL